MDIPKLYAIADRETFDGRGMSVHDFAEELRAGGVQMLQYRDKRNGPQEVLRAAREIAEVFAGTGATLILNDRADLAALLGWGVHVGQGDLPVEEARLVLGIGVPHSSRKEPRDEWATHAVEHGTADARHPAASGGIQGFLRSTAAKSATAPVEMTSLLVGVSTHDEEQVRVAENSAADYVATGPVFATSSKQDASPVVGLEGVRRARALTRKPLVAIGGITLQNARSVADAGADSVAVIGGLFVPGRWVRDVAGDFLALLR